MFEDVAKIVERELIPELFKAAEVFENESVDNAPVDTGALRDSIHRVQTGPTELRVRADENYGVFVEYGTVHQAPQGFMRAAFDKNAVSLAYRLEEAARKTIAQINKRVR